MNAVPCRALLLAALAAVRVKARAPELAIVLLAGLLVKEWQMVRELAMLHAWLDSGSGLGAIVVGLREHSYELTLIHDKTAGGATLSITTKSHLG